MSSSPRLDLDRALRHGALFALMASVPLTGCAAMDDALAKSGADGDMGSAASSDGGAGAGGSTGPALDAGVFSDAAGTGGGADAGSASGDAGAPPQLTSAEACQIVDEWGPDATDLDGDCFVADCHGHEADSRCALLLDCDDTRADVNPAATEHCNGRDDNCNGIDDEGFTIGDACNHGCGEGKTECSLRTQDAIVCSTDFGQSQAPPPESVAEICDGTDNNCDGVVDNDCRLNLQPHTQRSQPILCGGTLYALVDDALVRVADDGTTTTLADASRRPFAPACGTGGLAWLELNGDCTTPADGPERCPARIRALPAGSPDGAMPLEIASLGTHGRPAVAGNQVVWHTVLANTLTLEMRPIDASQPSIDVAANESDPAVGAVTGAATDRIAVRKWHGNLVEVFLQGVAEDAPGTYVLNPDEAAHPPALGDAWVVWSVTGVLWAVPLSTPDTGGFQVAATTSDAPTPRLEGNNLVWLDQSERTSRLMLDNLDSGISTVLATGDILPGDYTIAGGNLVYARQDGAVPGLYRIPLP